MFHGHLPVIAEPEAGWTLGAPEHEAGRGFADAPWFPRFVNALGFL